MNELIKLVDEWAMNRDLESQDPKAQFVKVVEELGELAKAIIRGNQAGMIDAFGDVFITLAILNLQLRWRGDLPHEAELEVCLRSSLAEVADRKGRIVDGSFIKEEDL